MLKLLVLLKQEVERVLQVLIAVDEDLVILIQIVHEVLHEEQVIGVERRQLDGREVTTMRLSILL